ncbi:MAG: hypothetical protein AAF570_26850, partial [Bacteroidota bacterium]
NLIEEIQRFRFRGKSSLGWYFRRIFRNMWHKILEKDIKTRMKRTEMADQAIEAFEQGAAETFEPGVDAILITRETREMIARFFRKMSPKCMKLIDLFLEGHSMTAIAEMLGYKNAGVASNTKKRCTENLKTQLKDDPEFLKFAREQAWKI